MLKTMRKANVKGFSLVELMVVVAIIGILAAVAIPNFQRFQRKSRQAEAKSNLGTIHQAQTVFYQSYDMFYGDLLETSTPVPVGTIFYNAGFNANGTDPVGALAQLYPKDAATISTGINNFANAAFCVLPCVAAPAGAAGRAGWTGGLPAATVDPAGAGNTAAFTAGAQAWIGGTNMDEWTLNAAKVLMNTQDGVL